MAFGAGLTIPDYVFFVMVSADGLVFDK